jgi:hypothetical protein
MYLASAENTDNNQQRTQSEVSKTKEEYWLNAHGLALIQPR